MSLSMNLWIRSKIYTKNYHFISLRKKKKSCVTSSILLLMEKNGSDYRKRLLYVSTWLIEFLSNYFVTTLFVTLSETKEIAYSSDDERSPQRLLQMTNLIFQHALIIHIYIRDDLVSLTPRKCFGVYLHAIMKHAGLRYRIVSSRSANTEKEEVMFTSIKTDTKLTSNFHSDQLVSNIIIRLQAREILNNGNASNKYKNSYLHTIYRSIKVTLRNSIIAWMRKCSNKYQCLLEQQNDFLLDSSCW